MRVVALSGVSREAGGLFYAVRSLCQSLKTCGVDVSVCGRDDPSASKDLASWNPVCASAFKAYGPMGYSPRMHRYLKNADCDLVHQHGIWMDDQRASLLWQENYDKPVVISPHGMLDPWAIKNSAWKKKMVGGWFANESLHKATCIHALCDSEVKSIRAYGLKNAIARIPNGVDLPDIGSKVNHQDRNRKKQLLFLGRIHPKKGLKELITGWAQTPGITSEWQLSIAGWDDGGYEAGLKSLCRELDIVDSVSFIGPSFDNAKDALFRSADAFILPSFSEGLPMTVLEAWSYQLPVIMTDFCNLPEGFNAGAAIRIDPSAESISQGLEKLAALSADELQVLGSSGRVLVEEKFTWPQIARNMQNVYEWCINGGTPPECMEFD